MAIMHNMMDVSFCMRSLFRKLLREQVYLSYSTQSKLSQNSAMNIFDRKTKLLQKERSCLLSDVHVYDYLKDEVGFRLADRIFDIKRKFKCAVDLGCGRGHVSKNIVADSVEKLILCDMSKTMVEQAAPPEENVKVERLVVDEEELPFKENSVDLFLSNLALHWVNDLPGTLSQISNCLVQDGVLLASVFGGDTLFELR